MIFSGPNERKGYLVYAGSEYIFQPSVDPNMLISLDERMRSAPLQDVHMKITDADVLLREETSNINVNNLFTELHNRIQEQQSHLHLNREDASPLRTYIIDYEIDRLRSHEMQLIIGTLVSELTQKPMLSKFKMEVLQSLRKSRGVFGEWPMIKYYFDPEQVTFYHVMPSGECFPCTTQQMHEVRGYIRDQQQQTPFPNSYIGFLALHNGRFNFKLWQNNKQSFGYVCSQTSSLTVNDLQNRVKSINRNAIKITYRYIKNTMCSIYEIVLRSKGETSFARHFHHWYLQQKKQQSTVNS
jgi:hypothetical protein